MKLFVLLSFVVGALSACGSNSGVSRATADLLLPPAEEVKLGKQLSAEAEQELKILEDPEVNAYITALGNKMVKQAGGTKPDEIKFVFKVVDDPKTINAFAMPGGFIYVYTGLIVAAKNESELIAVMGHEVAHVTRRHIAQRLVAMYGAQSLAAIALGNNPGLVGEIVAGVAANGYLLKHSRDAERDADAVGIRWVTGAGISPEGYVTFFQTLAKQGGSPPALLSSHPDPGERVQNARDFISKLSNPPKSTGDQAKFDAIKAKVR